MSNNLQELEGWLARHTATLIGTNRTLFVQQLGNSLRLTLTAVAWRATLHVCGWQKSKVAGASSETLVGDGSGFRKIIPTREQLHSAVWEIPSAAGHCDGRSVDDVTNALVLTFQSVALFAPLQSFRREAQSNNRPASTMVQSIVFENISHHNHLLSVWLCTPPHNEAADTFLTTVECETNEVKGINRKCFECFPNRRFMLRLPVGFLYTVLDHAPFFDNFASTTINTIFTLSTQGTVWIEQINPETQVRLSAVTADSTLERTGGSQRPKRL